ncbi:uncharacterized protein [Heterodontus francisci]|uniref:uncharacterized protein n=1 Tax=Heterodontus francisci TaxID=7792 RepID=UPI00355BEA55
MERVQAGQSRPVLVQYRQITLVTKSLTTSLILLTIAGCTKGALVVIQEPSFVSRLKGQSVSLNCSYTADQEKIYRSSVYWVFRQLNEEPTVIYPDTQGRFQDRLAFIKHSGRRNYTLQIDTLQLNDSETYYCYISFLVGYQSSIKKGQGTRLFVHEPLVLSPPSNCSCDAAQQRRVSCETRVPDPNATRIEWLRNGASVTAGNWSLSLLPASDGSYRLASHLELSSRSLDNEVKYTCLLHHTAGGVLERRQYIALSESCRHPILLYALILGNSAAVLLLIILFGLKKPRPV